MSKSHLYPNLNNNYWGGGSPSWDMSPSLLVENPAYVPLGHGTLLVPWTLRAYKWLQVLRVTFPEAFRLSFKTGKTHRSQESDTQEFLGIRELDWRSCKDTSRGLANEGELWYVCMIATMLQAALSVSPALEFYYHCLIISLNKVCLWLIMLLTAHSWLVNSWSAGSV